MTDQTRPASDPDETYQVGNEGQGGPSAATADGVDEQATGEQATGDATTRTVGGDSDTDRPA